jgi:hypothetical protein
MGGSITTAMLSVLKLIAIRSARLPELSIRSAMPMERAVSVVPSSNACRAVILNSRRNRPLLKKVAPVWHEQLFGAVHR